MPHRTTERDERKRDKRVPRARALRHDPSPAERKLWRALKTLELPRGHFRRQATIGPYFADFACHEARLVIEVDGDTHALPRQHAYDADRTAFLESRGYRVLRFWNVDVHHNLEGVFSAISDALHERLEKQGPPTPDPTLAAGATAARPPTSLGGGE